MARLAAVEKMLFYPTPTRVLRLIARSIDLTFEPGGALLDPCAGDGVAAAELAKIWGLHSVGVELDAARAAEAATRMDLVHRGSYHQIPKTTDVAAMLLNPPYDDAVSDTDGRTTRQEVLFLESTIGHLTTDGLLIYIVPRKILESSRFQTIARQLLREIHVFVFPSPEVEAFDQVVLVARRSRSLYIGFMPRPDEYVVLGEGEPVTGVMVPAGRMGAFELVGEDPYAFAPRVGPDATGVFATPRWSALTTAIGMDDGPPLVAPRPGHQAMLLAAGRLNGAEVAGFLMKGGSSKQIQTIENDNETIHREKIVSHLSALSLETGELDTWRVDQEQEKTAEWFRTHGDALAAAILACHTPLFDGDLSRFDFSGLRAPGTLPGHDEPELLEIQRQVSAAIVHLWKTEKSALLSGEPGTGKTVMGTVAAAVGAFRKTIVVCPSHLVSKWIAISSMIVGDPAASRGAKTLSEVDTFFEDTRARYLILSKEMAKLGARWQPAFATKRRIVHEEERYEDDDGRRRYRTVARVETLAVCASCGHNTEILASCMSSDLRIKCLSCSAPMWTAVPIHVREPNPEPSTTRKSRRATKRRPEATLRWPIATYINRRYARRFALVIDEAHQYAGSDTDQGRAIHKLAVASIRTLAMTGTWYGGRASSIFHLLYRLVHKFRESYSHTDCPKFVEHHGLFETVHKVEERTSTYGTRRDAPGGRIREIPGMSPAMIPMLLPYTIFLKLADLEVALPPYEEIVELIDHDPDVLKASQSLASELKPLLRKNPKALGAYVMACLGYPDRPDQGEEIKIIDPETDSEVVLAKAPQIPSQLWPKDLRVVEICQAEKKAGRRSLVYFAQTHRRDARGRVREALESAGLTVVVLPNSVASDKRDAWIRDADAKGFDVMLTNARLVETGMDLMFAHSIVWYGVEYSINVIRQASRRSWRLGQTEAIKVYFLAYRGTMQEIAVNLIARKMRAAEAIDGDEAGGLAQHDAGGSNLLVEVAHAAIERHSVRRRGREWFADLAVHAS